MSPKGYYRRGSADDDDEEEEDEAENGVEEEEVTQADEEQDENEEGEQICSVRKNYKPLDNKQLVDPSLQFWVHHKPFILPQGRVTW